MGQEPRGSADLVRRASSGDAVAVEELLERHLEDLRGYVKLHAGPAVLARESSSDLLQSVCREVLSSLEKGRFRFQGEGPFRKWLFRAALLKVKERHRYYLSQKRAAKREGAAVDSEGFPVLDRLPGSVGTPSVELLGREELQHLQTAFAQLPENYQQVILLSRVEGLSHKQIGERLDISEVNSRVLLSRAIARLARRVQDEDAAS